MQSYIITPKIAKMMLDKTFPVDEPVDVLFHDPELMRHAIVFKRPLFFQNEVEGTKSDIQLTHEIQGEFADPTAMKFGRCYNE
jgi:GR25 family glycosyltransferase involved in LPS biosynthesis